MKKSVAVAVLGLAVGIGFVGSATADDRVWPWSPIGIGLAAPAQIPFMSSDIYGLRFGGFLGYNNDVYGIDAGVAELSTGHFAGLQAAAMTWTEGNVYGIQAAALANMVSEKMLALQVAPVNAVWGDAGGLQVGLVNYDGLFAGLQAGGVLNWNNAAAYGLQVASINVNRDDFMGLALGGLVNYSEKFKGFACGVVNVSYEVTGYQLGVFNACDQMHGVQIGLINLICESKLPIMLIANASF